MSKDKIKALKEEIENLRKENLHLRTALNVKETEGENGQSVLSQEKIDSTVLALSRQLEELKTFNSKMNKALKITSQVEESLEALVPALEVQIRGYKREVDQLKVSSEDTADTYAGVVSNLETQIKQLKEDFAKKEAKFRQEADGRIQDLEAQIAALNEKPAEPEATIEEKVEVKKEKSRPSGPFTSLSIFMDQE